MTHRAHFFNIVDFKKVILHFFGKRVDQIFVLIFSSKTMDSSPCRNASKEPKAQKDPQRESSDKDSIGDVDQELERARVKALLTQQRFQQKRSHGKTT